MSLIGSSPSRSAISMLSGSRNGASEGAGRTRTGSRWCRAPARHDRRPTPRRRRAPPRAPRARRRAAGLGCRGPAHRERERQARRTGGHVRASSSDDAAKQQNEVCSIVQPSRSAATKGGRRGRRLGLPGCACRSACSRTPPVTAPTAWASSTRPGVAEMVGLDGVVIGDHVVLGNRLDRYPYPPVHFAHDASWMEPLSVLAAVAAVTTRIKLTTGVLVSPLRPAVLLAKTAATVDHLSGGRLELGVGVGWQPEEFAAVGVDFADSWGTADRRHRRMPGTLGERSGLVPILDHDLRRSLVQSQADATRGDPGPLLRLIGSSQPHANRRVGKRLDHAPPSAARRDRGRRGVAHRELRGARPRPRHAGRAHVAPDRSAHPEGEPDFEASFAGLGDHPDAGITDLTVWSNSFVDVNEHADERIAALGEAWEAPARIAGRSVSRLAGRVALVTGAAQGVGLGIALALATEGATIAVVDRNQAGAVEAAAECRRRGVRAEAFSCDVADRAEVTRTVAAVLDGFGGLQILVNNAHAFTLGIPLSTPPMVTWRSRGEPQCSGRCTSCRPPTRHSQSTAARSSTSDRGRHSTATWDRRATRQRRKECESSPRVAARVGAARHPREHAVSVLPFTPLGSLRRGTPRARRAASCVAAAPPGTRRPRARHRPRRGVPGQRRFQLRHRPDALRRRRPDADMSERSRQRATSTDSSPTACGARSESGTTGAPGRHRSETPTSGAGRLPCTGPSLHRAASGTKPTAAATRAGGIVAPEEFNPFAWPAPDPRAPRTRSAPDRQPDPGHVRRRVNGGCRATYGAPMRPGDRIRRRVRLQHWRTRRRLDAVRCCSSTTSTSGATSTTSSCATPSTPSSTGEPSPRGGSMLLADQVVIVSGVGPGSRHALGAALRGSRR